jgi:Type II secretion system (T2SS), protein M
MTARDRIVLIAVVVLVVLAGGYVLVLSPERHKAAEAQAQVQSARQQLETAQSAAASARSAEKRYAAAYSSLVSLGKAVPPSEEVPSLIYELELASNEHEVDFNSISSGSTSGSGSSSSATSTAAVPTSFTPMPFTFVFDGSFAGLAQLLAKLEGFAVRTSQGGIVVSGRLLTIQGADITLGSGGATGARAPLQATITATAYVLPASVGLTGGATPLGPSTAGNGSSSSSSSSSSATPAVVKVTP